MTAKVLSGGDKLEAALAKLSKNIEKASTVQVGWAEGATYPNGTPVAAIAAIQEYGAPNAAIPARSFFRSMIAARSGEWGAELGGWLKVNDYDAAKALDAMGTVISADLAESIRDIDAPALSPVTLMLRAMFPVSRTYEKTGKDVGVAAQFVAAGISPDEVGDGAPSDKPLVWTGQMLRSITSVVS